MARTDRIAPVSGPERDERTIAVENASYRLGYLFVTYALLIVVALRAWVRGEPAWDLLAIVVLSGLVVTVHQTRQRILGRRWLVWALGVVVVAAAISALLIWILPRS